MILSPYRNPPYRSPTPGAPSTATETPPPPGTSPKRKRTESKSRATEALRVQTNLREDLSDSLSGCDSPRSKVAEKLRDLEIDRARTERDSDGDVEGGAKRKRLKGELRPQMLSPSPVKDLIIAETPLQSRGRPEDSSAEIQETPQTDRQRSSSPTAPEDALVNFRNAYRASQSHSEVDPRPMSPEATPLPPSPKVIVSPCPREPISDRALSPLQLNDELSFDQATLTWQNSEITGHEIDDSLGDDGLGINGIGFRPTPAMAYARSQKRKQQVREWNMREAREARQRRMERRRGGSGGERAGDGSEVKRVVRFEEG